MFEQYHAEEYERRSKVRKASLVDDMEQAALLLAIFAVYFLGCSIAYPF